VFELAVWTVRTETRHIETADLTLSKTFDFEVLRNELAVMTSVAEATLIVGAGLIH